MARYTGPKLELLVNLAIFGDDKAFEEVTHLDNTGWQKEVKI
jgi:hypothetical protein